MSMIDTRGRDWCFTSYAESMYDKLKNCNIEKNSIYYLIYQLEKCPETGKEHVQGFVQFKNARLMEGVKKVFKDKTMHLEQRMGSVEKAAGYCKKDESRLKEPIELGEIKMYDNKGKRNDIQEMYDMLKCNNSIDDIREYNPSAYVKYYKAFDRIKNDIESKNIGKYEEIEINVLYGPPGTGKTRYVFDKEKPENVYKMNKSNNDNIWFDGYKGQKVLLIDDYYGWIKYGKFLEMIDNYRMQLEIKGGICYSNWSKVYITSNANIEDWYKKGLTEAIRRRINNIYNVKEVGKMYIENKKYELTKNNKVNKIITWEIIEENEESIDSNNSNINITVKENEELLENNAINELVTTQRLSGNTILTTSTLLKKNTDSLKKCKKNCKNKKISNINICYDCVVDNLEIEK